MSGFKEALDIPRSHLVGTLLKEAVPELDGIAKRSQDQRSPFFLVCRGKEEPLKLTVQEIRDMNHRRLTMIHCHMDQPALERLPGSRGGYGRKRYKERRGLLPALMITGRPTAALCAWWRRPDGSP